MLPNSPVDSAQTSFFGIAHQLNVNHPLLALGRAIDWPLLEDEWLTHAEATLQPE